ncbi:hypothetical protein HNQ51_001717 [Inhella inkyongensis]|uniref:Uncharacterized protein n=1 Tax=Inhella inkyongensis TaxID=392593 RepID=A0A840S3V4_9BURK|nr:hypothetical protein [Inhella inkyongensis]MBB5204403.1 hypothetical protein [Inhella inkyongensis]
MLTTRIFRPTMTAGVVYARLLGSAAPLQSIGGIAELILNVEEEIKKQKDFSRGGGGNRAQVNRIDSVTMSAKLQDLNPVNLARVVFGNTAAVVSSTVTGEAVTGYKGGLIKLAHLNPSVVVLKKAAVTIAAAGNYEVRPEGLFVLDSATGITDGDALTVDYAFGGYDVIEALTEAAPTLEMLFAGVNEAMEGAANTVELHRVKTGALKSWGLINDDFAELDIEGEVLLDPTKTGAGTSKFFKVRMQ